MKKASVSGIDWEILVVIELRVPSKNQLPGGLDASVKWVNLLVQSRLNGKFSGKKYKNRSWVWKLLRTDIAWIYTLCRQARRQAGLENFRGRLEKKTTYHSWWGRFLSITWNEIPSLDNALWTQKFCSVSEVLWWLMWDIPNKSKLASSFFNLCNKLDVVLFKIVFQHVLITYC